MAFSIELNFDDKSNLIVKNMWRRLSEKGISDYMHKHGGFPHIALAVFNDINVLEIEKIIEKVVEGEHNFTIKMSSLGIFPSDESVLFLSPAVSENLINFHGRLHDALKDIKEQWEYYLPGFWVPHCTLGMNIPRTKIQEALDVIIEDFEPFDVKMDSLKIVEFNPDVKVAKSFKLKGKESQ